MNPYVSKLEDCALHESGWLEISGGSAISRLPIIDKSTGLYARLGHGPGGKWASEQGWRLPTVQEYDLLHKSCIFIAPYTLPTSQMLKDAKINTSSTKAIDTFRNSNMRSFDWCKQHDDEVAKRLSAVNWNGEPVSNAGKHWVQGGLIYGWWKSDGTKIQNPSGAHKSDVGYTDYATNFHVVRPAPAGSIPRRTNLGEKGSDVLAWQQFLISKGFNPGTPDGIHGKRLKKPALLGRNQNDHCSS